MAEVEACGSIVILIVAYYIGYSVVGDFIDTLFSDCSRGDVDGD